MEFKDLDIKEMDRDLTAEQQNEWNAIYASYRSGSVLNGKVVGVDTQYISITDSETGKSAMQAINCLVVISYRVKVLIPEQQVWFNEDTKRPPHVLRTMTGAYVDYVITGIDRENECCTASRRNALIVRRKAFLKLPPKTGKKIEVNILAVGGSHLLANCNGFDMTLSAKDLSYGMIIDMREKYHSGEIYPAIVKEYNPEAEKIYVSVKEAKVHPFDGVEIRHPLNCRRASVISGKYKGGVFCKIEEELDCLCTYSPYQNDSDFKIGDQVIVAITRHDFDRKLVYGKIVAKW